MKAGGSALKVYVASPLRRKQLLDELQSVAERNGYVFVHVDGSVTKLHLMPDILFSIAKQISWRDSIQTFLTARLGSLDLTFAASDLSCETIAFLNNISRRDARKKCFDMLATEIYKDYNLTLDFRLAMSALCQCVLEPGDYAESLSASLIEWLTGDLRFVVNVRDARIYKKINKGAARAILSSIPVWLRKTGYAGLVATIDISRLTQWKRGSSGQVYYTRARTLDAYEVQRQFIDEAEEFGESVYRFACRRRVPFR